MTTLLWADVDKMYYSVEVLERPELRLAEARFPVVIGHDPRTSPRSIVTTANAAARALGITSGMSTAIARRKAPGTILFLPPRHELYADYSRRLMELLRTETPLLERCSIDEAVLDWAEHGFAPAPVVRLRRRVLDELGLSVSFGVGANRLIAKVASEAAKDEPDHVRIVRPGEEAAFLAPRPIRALVGVGPKHEQRLVDLGLATIGDVAAQPLERLVDEFGSAYGRHLFEASHGRGSAELVESREYKSISEETTFDHDTAGRAEIWRRLRRQAEAVARKLQGEGLVAAEVAVKVRYANWETITRQQRLGAPTADGAVLAAGAAALMKRHWQPHRPIRLIGLRVARLQPLVDAQQLPLL
jgi:DNA polymerase IV